MKNTIYSNEEYLAQGFTVEELPLIRKHDIMFNNFDSLSDEEKTEFYSIIEKLNL